MNKAGSGRVSEKSVARREILEARAWVGLIAGRRGMFAST